MTPNQKPPLWLPPGSVRAIMALSIVLGTLGAVLLGANVPDELLYLAGAIATAYTGVRAWQQNQNKDSLMQAFDLMSSSLVQAEKQLNDGLYAETLVSYGDEQPGQPAEADPGPVEAPKPRRKRKPRVVAEQAQEQSNPLVDRVMNSVDTLGHQEPEPAPPEQAEQKEEAPSPFVPTS